MYTLDTQVRFSECTEHGYLGIEAIMNYFQDVALFLNEEAGRGIAHMQANHLAFFVLAWQIEVDHIPRYLDRIRILSWTPEMGRTSATRCFTIEDADGNVHIRSQGQFCAIDTDSGRPMRFPASERVYLEADTAPIFARQPRKVQVPVGGECFPEVVVEPHMVDANHHMNNVYYLQIAVDRIRMLDETFTPRALTIQYVRAARLGDAITARLVRTAGGWAAELADARGAAFACLTCQG